MTTDPTATPGASMGGRGTDPALMARIAAGRDAEPLHWLEQTVTTTETSGSQHRTAAEAYAIRVKRLREAGTEYTADPKSLTVTYTVQRGGQTVTTTLRYREAT